MANWDYFLPNGTSGDDILPVIRAFSSSGWIDGGGGYDILAISEKEDNYSFSYNGQTYFLTTEGGDGNPYGSPYKSTGWKNEVSIALYNIEEVQFIDKIYSLTGGLEEPPAPAPTPTPEPEPTPAPTPNPSTTPETPGVPDSSDKITYNRIIGTSKKDRLNGTNGNDEIIGGIGADKINGKGGDDLIDPGKYKKGKYDLVKGGSGSDTFIIKNDYWAYLKDFNVFEDKLDLSGLKGGLDFSYEKKWTKIWGDEFEIARIKGKVDLNLADIV